MRKAIILLCVVTTTSSSPASPLDPQISMPTPFVRQFQRRNGLPPISAVLMALEAESILPPPYVTPAVDPSSVDSRTDLSTSTSSTTISSSATSSTSTSLPITTLPYLGPGILILPESSSTSSSDASFSSKATSATAAPTPTNSSKEPSHMSTTMRHFVVAGVAFGTIIFLVVCCYFVMDPRIWKACLVSRKDIFRLSRKQRSGQRPLPSWMRITPSFPSPDRSFEKKGLPTLSPYPYSTSDGLKSKFSMTTASDYSYCEDTLDTTILSPQMSDLPYNGHCHLPAVSPPLSSYLPATDHIGNPNTHPIRPPRPPTVDSPAAIDSIYYADVEDQGFYRHPNPIVLEPTSPIINNPPPMPRFNSQPQSHPNFLPPSHRFFSSNPLGIDALQRHARSRSAPTLDTPSTSSKHLSGATITTQETSESTTRSESPSPQKTHTRTRKSTSAVSWIRYSEFQKQHHLQLQQQQSNPDEWPTAPLCPSPSKERDAIGSAY